MMVTEDNCFLIHPVKLYSPSFLLPLEKYFELFDHDDVKNPV